MVHNQKFVASIKTGAKFLREYSDRDSNHKIYIPFGSEYSIYLKNLHSQLAVVDISIDGRDVIDGLIVDGSSNVELERFYDVDRKFKFIEKTDKIRDHRGENPEDGLVVIKYKFQKVPTIIHYTNWVYDSSNSYWNQQNKGTAGALRSASSQQLAGDQSFSSESIPQMFSAAAAPVNDSGITAEGSESDQEFTTRYVGDLEVQTHTIILQLIGDVGQEKVKKAVTTREKITCKYCGTKNRSSNKYCSECGAALLS